MASASERTGNAEAAEIADKLGRSLRNESGARSRTVGAELAPPPLAAWAELVGRSKLRPYASGKTAADAAASHAGVVGRRPVDRRHLRAHRSEIARELAAV